MDSPPLSLHVAGFSGRPGSGSVVLVNHSGGPVRVWRTGNEWGDEALSFELSLERASGRVVRRQQIYTRNVPSTIAVAAGGRHEWAFDFGDGSWEPDVPFEEMLRPGAELSALYEAKECSESIANGVWSGRLRSESVSWGWQG